MTIRDTCKSATIITAAVVMVCAMVTAGVLLALAGAALGVVFLGVVIVTAIVMAVTEEIVSWFKRKLPRKAKRPATQ